MSVSFLRISTAMWFHFSYWNYAVSKYQTLKSAIFSNYSHWKLFLRLTSMELFPWFFYVLLCHVIFTSRHWKQCFIFVIHFCIPGIYPFLSHIDYIEILLGWVRNVYLLLFKKKNRGFDKTDKENNICKGTEWIDAFSEFHTLAEIGNLV